MPIISQVGQKAWSVRVIHALLYLLLTVGGVTMLYPFLLMVATSLTDQVDYNEYRVIPRYFTEDEAKYQKFIAEKYASAKTYSEMHAHDYQAFRQIGMPTFDNDPKRTYSGVTDPDTGEEVRLDPQTELPTPPRLVIDATWPQVEKRVALWRDYQTTLPPLDFGVWHVGGQNMPGKSEMIWRDLLRKRFDDDVALLNRTLEKDLTAFTEAFAPYDKPDGRLWPGVSGKEGLIWAEFKQTLDPRYRRPVDGTFIWQRFLRYQYEKIERLNKALDTTYADFRDVPLRRSLPQQAALAKHWEDVVRNELPYRAIRIAGGDAKYRAFLLGEFADLAALNRQLGTDYARAEDITWPPRRTTTRELVMVSTFLRTVPAAADMTVATPDMRYEAFVRERFEGDLAKANAELGTDYASFDDVRPPYEEEDLWEFQQDKDEWMSWYLTRNYSEVIDYVAIRGRALWNTVILIAAMIFCALTVNPLAAYALSRFRLGYTNQVLLFLLATMAFPYEVAMIPNFLLLRRFPLWTWLVGLIVGGIVAFIMLRRAKGRKKWIAIPVGLGSAVIAGIYLTPLIGRMFGIEEIGSISLLNTFAALILPRMASGYSIFLLKGFFDSLPEELFEAGKIDGASELRMFWQVAFPLSKPIFAVMALQTFTAIYGSYIWALVVCQSDKMWTLMVYIFQLQQFAPQYVTMAATVLASIPTLLVFIFAQKTIMRGIIIPAFK